MQRKSLPLRSRRCERRPGKVPISNNGALTALRCQSNHTTSTTTTANAKTVNLHVAKTPAAAAASAGAIVDAETAPFVHEDGHSSDRSNSWRIYQTLFQHLWPLSSSNADLAADIRKRKQRVVTSLGLVVAGKAVTIQVPFMFKGLVDALPHSTEMIATATTTGVLATDPVLPVALLLGYGASRAAAAGFQEWRNAVFQHVAQDAIRTVGREVLDHVLSLDLQFHLSRSTGKLARVLDRGQRSIAFVLNAMVFHVGPTVLELALVTGLMLHQFGTTHAAVVLTTVVSYTAFTFAVSTWYVQQPHFGCLLVYIYICNGLLRRSTMLRCEKWRLLVLVVIDVLWGVLL